jgi:uncharacterized protein (DUF169 family)
MLDTDRCKSIASSLLESLSCRQVPVALSLTNEVPADVEPYVGVVPAGCRFWEEAQTQVFYTLAPDHELCTIGIHTHGLSGRTPAMEAELQRSLVVMGELDTVREGEVGTIPVLTEQVAVVVYGPLAELPVAPDVVLLMLDGQQGLLVAEAANRVDGQPPVVLGRPACAVVPEALNSGRVALSLGCCGARAYLDGFSPETGLWALPGPRIEEYAREIKAFAEANATLAVFHKHRRDDVDDGLKPTIDQSLSRGKA